ncbi:NAD(P)-binding protein [Ophiobolus disseminans]|uniref:NAD(P)-binding protein n=1 Tax=Ophiobolus disseminans TaxID=1469910 RepID=A0A6A7AI50_9PLEO|nr:NAD(P)-binding protein [Ophiobolus disseminans]
MTPDATILVTGAGGGLGSAIAAHVSCHLPRSIYHAIYTVRDTSRPHEALRAALLSPHGSQSQHEVLSLDLARLSSVRALAASVNRRVASGEIPPIRALVLNAGLLEFEKQTWAADADGGFDMTFASNYLGHWLLTLLLLQSMDRDCGRIVVIGSSAHDPAIPMIARHYPYEVLKTFIHGSADPLAKGTWSSNKEDPTYHSGFRRYGAAKMCLAMMVGELQQRLAADPALSRITTIGVDPGTMSTGIVRHSNWFVRVVVHGVIIATLARLIAIIWSSPNGALRTPEKSASDVMDAALAARWQKGGFYLDGSELSDMSEEAKDPDKRALVWQDSSRYADLKQGDTMLVNWN